MSIDDFDNIPEDDVDDVFRDVLNLVMEKIEDGTNPMALAGVMMAQAMMMYKTHLKEDDYNAKKQEVLDNL